MLEIKPTTNTRAIAALCRKCGEIPDESLYAYVAASGSDTLAAVLFRMESESARAVYYESTDQGDYFLLDGLLRAGFHFAAEQGVKTGCIPESFRQLHAEMFARLNYPAAHEFGIDNFFAKYKNCNI